MLPCTESARPIKTSRFDTYFHLPRMPVPRLSVGTALGGRGALTMVQPVVTGVGGGVTVQTRPSPHQSLKSLRTGSNSRPQLPMLMAPLDSSVGNSPLGSTGVIILSRFPGSEFDRSQKMNGVLRCVDRNIFRIGS